MGAGASLELYKQILMGNSGFSSEDQSAGGNTAEVSLEQGQLWQ